MRRVFAITLFVGLFAANVNICCQTLCMVGNKVDSSSHASHAAVNGHRSESNICPTDHGKDQHASHHSRDTRHETRIQCDCSMEHVASIGFEFSLEKPLTEVTHFPRTVSTIQVDEIIVSSFDPSPLEEPPDIQA